MNGTTIGAPDPVAMGVSASTQLPPFAVHWAKAQSSVAGPSRPEHDPLDRRGLARPYVGATGVARDDAGADDARPFQLRGERQVAVAPRGGDHRRESRYRQTEFLLMVFMASP